MSLSALSKLGLSFVTVAIGGGTAAGWLFSSSNKNQVVSVLGQGSGQLTQGATLSNPANPRRGDTQAGRDSLPEDHVPQAKGPESLQPLSEKTVIQKEGNCSVIAGPQAQETVSLLPPSFTRTEYIAFFCDNGDSDGLELTKWVGLFPLFLLKGNKGDYQVGEKFQITARNLSEEEILSGTIDAEEEMEDDEEEGEEIEQEGFQTEFTSDQFRTQTIVGFWGGDTLVETFWGPDIYEVKTIGDNMPDNFFLQWFHQDMFPLI